MGVNFPLRHNEKIISPNHGRYYNLISHSYMKLCDACDEIFIREVGCATYDNI